jgi:hypothetical protein
VKNTYQVELCKASELALGDGGSKLGGDQSVGVGGVTDNKNLGRYRTSREIFTNLHGLLGHLIEGSPLLLEDLNVGGQKILALHAIFAGHGTDLEVSDHNNAKSNQKSNINVGKGNIGLAGDDDTYWF